MNIELARKMGIEEFIKAKKTTVNMSDVEITINTKGKYIYISISDRKFNDCFVDDYLSIAIDRRLKRVYLFESEKGYKFSHSGNSTRYGVQSLQLYDEMKKMDALNSFGCDLKYNKELEAYYFEIL